MKRVIWWIRRDLRLKDNQALHAALSRADEIVPLFIKDNKLWDSPYFSNKRGKFYLNGIRALDRDLQKIGSRLIVRQGNPVEILDDVIRESGSTELFAEADFSPYARKRDDEVSKRYKVNFEMGVTVRHPGQVLKSDGDPYTVFTPFSKTWKSFPMPGMDDILDAPGEIRTPPEIRSNSDWFPQELDDGDLFPAGEKAAHARLEEFLQKNDVGLKSYKQNRDTLHLDGTSRLSPYLRFGMLSAREAVAAALIVLGETEGKQSRKSIETWINELIWREFFISILYHFPIVRAKSFREKYREMKWINDISDFHDWKNGQTGYPVVDASMRQLKQIGWMHNRGRMITASFLTKHLLIDWRWGERYFMNHLLDGDPASNNGGWQWSAGTGTDAAPYFRIFNPILQSKKHDPDGEFIRRWIPELRQVPSRFIHEPWTMDRETQQKTGCLIGKDYPAPIVDHSYARERALEVYKQVG